MDKKCPGADMRFVKVEICKCPNCGYEVELFSNETMVKCPACKNAVYHEKTPSCIDWCKSARECLGEERWQKLKGHIDETQEKIDFKEKILLEMRKYFKEDIQRIQHAEKVAKYAEQLLEKEGGDRNIVVPAAILHDIGIKECERKYNSTDGQLQEKEGPPIAGEILKKLGIKNEAVTEICRIIGSHHSPGEVKTLNFNILWDSDWLVNLREEMNTKDRGKLKAAIDKLFLTASGKKLAEREYL